MSQSHGEMRALGSLCKVGCRERCCLAPLHTEWVPLASWTGFVGSGHRPLGQPCHSDPGLITHACFLSQAQILILGVLLTHTSPPRNQNPFTSPAETRGEQTEERLQHTDADAEASHAPAIMTPHGVAHGSPPLLRSAPSTWCAPSRNPCLKGWESFGPSFHSWNI